MCWVVTLCQTPCLLSSFQVWQIFWHTAVVMQQKHFLHTSTVCSVLIFISEEKWWLVQWTTFSSRAHQHWCHHLSFTCIVESLAVKGYELMEIWQVVVPKNKIPLSYEQTVSVHSGTGPVLPVTSQVLSSFIVRGPC